MSELRHRSRALSYTSVNQVEQDENRKDKRDSSRLYKGALSLLVVSVVLFLFSNDDFGPRKLLRRELSPLNPRAAKQLYCASGRYFARKASTATNDWCQSSCSAVGTRNCLPTFCQCANPLFEAKGAIVKLDSPEYTELTNPVPINKDYIDTTSKHPMNKSYSIDFGAQKSYLYVSDCCMAGDQYTISVDGQVIGQTPSSDCTSATECAAKDVSTSFDLWLLDAGQHKVDISLSSSYFGTSGVYTSFARYLCPPVKGFFVHSTAATFAQAAKLCTSQKMKLATVKSSDLQSVGDVMSNCIPSTSVNESFTAWIASWNGSKGPGCMAVTWNKGAVTVNVDGDCDQARTVLCSSTN